MLGVAKPVEKTAVLGGGFKVDVRNAYGGGTLREYGQTNGKGVEPRFETFVERLTVHVNGKSAKMYLGESPNGRKISRELLKHLLEDLSAAGVKTMEPLTDGSLLMQDLRNVEGGAADIQAWKERIIDEEKPFQPAVNGKPQEKANDSEFKFKSSKEFFFERPLYDETRHDDLHG